MSIEWILVLVFFVIAGIYSFFSRNNTVGKLEPLPGEKTVHILEITKLARNAGRRNPTIYPKCLMKITNKRLIIGQKIPFRQDHILLYVLDYSSEPGLKGTNVKLKLSYSEIITSVPFLLSSYRKDEKKYHIPLTHGSVLTDHEWIAFESEPLDQYFQTAQKSSA